MRLRKASLDCIHDAIKGQPYNVVIAARIRNDLGNNVAWQSLRSNLIWELEEKLASGKNAINGLFLDY